MNKLFMWFKKYFSGFNRRSFLFMPYFVFACIFIILPIIFLFLKSFIPSEEGFDNWYKLKDGHTMNIIFRSVLIGFLTSIISIIIAIPYAYLIARMKNKTMRFVAIIFTVSPLFVFTISRVIALRGLLLSIFDEPTINGLWFTVLGLVYLNLAFSIIPLYSTFYNMPNSIVEASYDLGFNKMETLWRVVLPYSLKAIFSSISIVFLLSATSIIVSHKLASNPDTYRMVGNILDDESIRTSTTAASSSSAVALVTMIIMISIYYFIYFMPRIIFKIKGVNID